MGDWNCMGCGQPMLPEGETKRPNEHDHASGCPFDKARLDENEREIRAIYDGWGESDDTVDDLVKRLTYLVRADRARIAELEAVLMWYATVPRDEDGATMPLDMGEKARTVLARRF